ncbi:hypothetical protein SELMODRAFT_416041 [Selaginella moellendorffii]|uniref:Uncharacterized protein n=1 Tax=Selaginella moellendorffii TaxID=88036 RepID=D8RXW2_SELML|nr:hypothetical protein SELMODRAFT_416041 [Selaginella moellendorffii]
MATMAGKERFRGNEFVPVVYEEKLDAWQATLNYILNNNDPIMYFNFFLKTQLENISNNHFEDAIKSYMAVMVYYELFDKLIIAMDALKESFRHSMVIEILWGSSGNGLGTSYKIRGTNLDRI